MFYLHLLNVLYKQSIYGWDRTSAYTEKITIYTYCVENNSKVSFQSNPLFFPSTFAQKCKVIYERYPKSHARCITFAVLTHKGQPQHRELRALLFSNSVWAVYKELLKNHNQSKIIEPITSTHVSYSRTSIIRTVLLKLKCVTQTNLPVKPTPYLSVIIIGRVVTHHF